MTVLHPRLDHELRESGQESGGEVQLAEEEVVVMEEVDSDGEGEAEPQQLPPVDTSTACLICKKPDAYIEFAAWPCGCPSMCRSCAQKLCTGGKCRVCHEMFPEIKRCRLSSST